jgi:hypothetical protein
MAFSLLRGQTFWRALSLPTLPEASGTRNGVVTIIGAKPGLTGGLTASALLAKSGFNHLTIIVVSAGGLCCRSNRLVRSLRSGESCGRERPRRHSHGMVSVLGVTLGPSTTCGLHLKYHWAAY